MTTPPLPGTTPPRTAEMMCSSSFSFCEGASSPEELIEEATRLRLTAVAITDRDGVYGLPRAWRRWRELAQEHGQQAVPRLVCGARITIEGGPGAVLLVQNLAGWSALCRLLTHARCAGTLDLHPQESPHTRGGSEKGHGRVPLSVLLSAGESSGLDVILVGDWHPTDALAVAASFPDCTSLALRRHLDGADGWRTAAAQNLSQHTGIPLLATTAPLSHHPSRQTLQDVLTCIRLGCTLDEAGTALAANAERHLRSPAAFWALFADTPAAIHRGLVIADRCRFSLAELHYQYPREVVPPTYTAMSWLRELTRRGVVWRYPDGAPAKVMRQIEHELDLIERLDFPAYFLTVHDAVRFAQERGILCQGRGSAANSAVCFVLGVTAVDPASTNLLFERFISEERGEPPDIDVDFEHERREEVIQYIFNKYGRHRAAMVCNIITWRSRSAVRDTGGALGLSRDQLDQLASQVQWFDRGKISDEQLKQAGLDPSDHRVRLTLEIAAQLRGHPRHLGLHSGGFTISDGPLVDLCPIEPATMVNRTVLQWDKDDIDTVGFIKVDVLALGMLTCIRRTFDLVQQHWMRPLSLASVPNDDSAVYDMLCKADTVGVFQIESRAQMSMLPRLKPRNWYDIVVEVSIVRPGPIQGGMVHPYLRRRNGDEPVTYAHPALEPILARTSGVPIFQEQVMAMAVAVGGFTPGQADQLRRAMGAWRKRGGLEPLVQRLMDGMSANGITRDYAEQIANQIKGFGEYGFPESHAASFARLVYVSSWLKCHYPAAFAAALVNSQPMGFYSPRSILGDAQRHGVAIHPVDVRWSHWDCTLEKVPSPSSVDITHDHAIRIGFRLVKGLSEASVLELTRARSIRPFSSIGDLFRRTRIERHEVVLLARAGALDTFAPDRRQAIWMAEGLVDLPLFRGLLQSAPEPALPPTQALDELREDFRIVGLSTRHDPLRMVRPSLQKAGILSARDVTQQPAGTIVDVAGIVSNRQRPGTASGIVFMTLEDETGMLNLVVKPKLFDAQRVLILQENLLRARARVQRDGDSVSLLCFRFMRVQNIPHVQTRSRDFH